MIKRPMKGVALEEDQFDQLTFPLYGSPKIDGFRCVLGEHPLTSRLSRFPNEFFHRNLSGVLPCSAILDSEVVVGRRRGPGVLSRTSSGLTSVEGEPDFTLWVFDRPGLSDRPGWYDRYLAACELIESVGHPRIKLLKHKLLLDLDDLHRYIDSRLSRGYEGVMVRSIDGPYKEGKSTLREQYLLKIKPFDTAEGRIKGWFEEQENTNEAKREVTGKLKRSSAKSGKVPKGSLGGFILDDIKDGTEVRVGGGFTRAQRVGLWRLIQSGYDFQGTLVRYKKQRVGQKEKARHPGFVDFVDFRPEFDFIEDD